MFRTCCYLINSHPTAGIQNPQPVARLQQLLLGSELVDVLRWRNLELAYMLLHTLFHDLSRRELLTTSAVIQVILVLLVAFHPRQR